MANLDFFAAEMDQRAVLDFLFSSTDELAAAFPLGTDRHGSGFATNLQLWSPSVMAELEIVRIPLVARIDEEPSFRFTIEGGALIQLQFGGVNGRVITKSHFGHQSQTRAQTWGVDHGVNWDALSKLSNRIQYRIRKLAAAKVPGRSILPQAYELARSGYSLKEYIQVAREHQLPPASEA